MLIIQKYHLLKSGEGLGQPAEGFVEPSQVHQKILAKGLERQRLQKVPLGRCEMIVAPGQIGQLQDGIQVGGVRGQLASQHDRPALITRIAIVADGGRRRSPGRALETRGGQAALLADGLIGRRYILDQRAPLCRRYGS